MELLWNILEEIAGILIMATFVLCCGIAFMAIKRFRHNPKKLIRGALAIVGSLFCLLNSLSSASAFAMALFVGGLATPIAYGALFLRFDDSREKKDDFLKQITIWTLIIAFAIGVVTALIGIGESGASGLLSDIAMSALGAFIAAGAVWVFAVNIPEDDYCPQCGSYGEIYCKQEDHLNKKITKEWDSEEWEETKRGNVVVNESKHKKYHNIRYHYTALMQFQCEHCGHEYQKMEERDEDVKTKIGK